MGDTMDAAWVYSRINGALKVCVLRDCCSLNCWGRGWDGATRAAIVVSSYLRTLRKEGIRRGFGLLTVDLYTC